ncbi:Methionine import ATP-binding protein MetN [Weissella viridescens]|uniref:Methionine import ATP-binding protein MetN n=1 Tax=Weissella viridescens TaxID=1629 RepID=A0A380P817_WEIVI|nr:Methionine import ATP-binding protein MetN [Weissella viridescens]
MVEDRKKLVEIKNLDITFNKGRKNQTLAVQNASFDIYEGETFGLVGESGSGKTTIGRTIMKLNAPTAGEVRYDGTDVTKIKRRLI